MVCFVELPPLLLLQQLLLRMVVMLLIHPLQDRLSLW